MAIWTANKISVSFDFNYFFDYSSWGKALVAYMKASYMEERDLPRAEADKIKVIDFRLQADTLLDSGMNRGIQGSP